MRKILLCALLVSLASATYAQPRKPYYEASAGLLGALNFDKIRDAGSLDFKYDWQFRYGFGVWANFPFAEKFSFEPQAMVNMYRFKSDDADYLQDADVRYFSIPVVIKYHLSKNFALLAGPQFDITWKFEDNTGQYDREKYAPTSGAVLFGFEVFPRSRFSGYARYIHGLDNVDDRKRPEVEDKFRTQNFQVGVKVRLFGGQYVPGDRDGDRVIDIEDSCPDVPGIVKYKGCPIPDTDGDGVNDEIDQCITVPGLAKYNGCPIPDTDGDGLNDEEDKCPTVPGLAKYQGCPIPDTDGDGINDEEDKCPTVAGLAKYQGCPIPDTDGDGINDEEDRCPNVPGVRSMQGCPEIKYEASSVTFAVNSAVLTSSGKAELDKLVAYLETHPDIRVKLDGHTDASGNDKINIPLSENRAISAKDYLVSKGINADRVSTEGHGSSEPVADNNTKEGKAKNRRIEVTIQ